MEDKEIKTLEIMVYEKRLFIFLFRKIELKKHNTIETRHRCGTSHYEIYYFNRTS